MGEPELLQMLGVKKDSLSVLRKKGLPYVRLSKTCRVYVAQDLLEYFETLKGKDSE